jgi:hypothetical protein
LSRIIYHAELLECRKHALEPLSAGQAPDFVFLTSYKSMYQDVYLGADRVFD